MGVVERLERQGVVDLRVLRDQECSVCRTLIGRVQVREGEAIRCRACRDKGWWLPLRPAQQKGGCMVIPRCNMSTAWDAIRKCPAEPSRLMTGDLSI